MPRLLEPSEVKELARKTANKYNLDEDKFLWVVGCESSFNPKAVGDGGKSFGAAQIYLPAHPEITEEQAKDPHWALDWMAKEWQAKRERKWTCARKY